MAIKYSFKMSDDEIQRGIKSIGVRAASLRADIHYVMVSIMLNWAKSGSVNVCAERMGALLGQVDPAHAQKLVNWVAKHAGFTLEEVKGADASFKYSAEKTKLTEAEWAAAKSETMFDLTPDAALKPFDLRAELAKLIEKAEKRPSSSKKTDQDVIDLSVLRAAKAALAPVSEAAA